MINHLVKLLVGIIILSLIVAFISLVMTYQLVAWAIVALGALGFCYTLGDIYLG